MHLAPLVVTAAESEALGGVNPYFVGGGILQAGAWDELRELAEMLQAPVLMSSSGRGASPCCCSTSRTTCPRPSCGVLTP